MQIQPSNWVVTSGSTASALVDGWPSLLVSAPSLLSYKLYIPEYSCGYISYVLSGDTVMSLRGVSADCSNIGNFCSSGISLLPGDLTITLQSDTDYVLGPVELEGFPTMSVPLFQAATTVLFDRELKTPNPLLMTSSNGRCSVFHNGNCIGSFLGSKTLGCGPGRYKVLSDSLGTVTLTEGPPTKPFANAEVYLSYLLEDI